MMKTVASVVYWYGYLLQELTGLKALLVSSVTTALPSLLNSSACAASGVSKTDEATTIMPIVVVIFLIMSPKFQRIATKAYPE
jgi:hypothetical protein